MSGKLRYGSAAQIFGCRRLLTLEKAFDHLVVQRKGGAHWLVNYDHFQHFAIVGERAFMFDGPRLPKQEILPSIWCRHDCKQPQAIGLDAHAGFLEDLTRACLLPCLSAHLIAAGQREFAMPVCNTAADHQKAASDRHEDNDDSRCVVIVVHD